jgi:hypothetical protein
MLMLLLLLLLPGPPHLLPAAPQCCTVAIPNQHLFSKAVGTDDTFSPEKKAKSLSLISSCDVGMFDVLLQFLIHNYRS